MRGVDERRVGALRETAPDRSESEGGGELVTEQGNDVAMFGCGVMGGGCLAVSMAAGRGHGMMRERKKEE